MLILQRTNPRRIDDGIQAQAACDQHCAIPKHDHSVLVLQGGGALGAYQAGVYEGMAEKGFAPDWVTGVSIGAINAALIAGNPPARRIERLREFWDQVSSGLPLIAPAFLDPVATGVQSRQRDRNDGFWRPRLFHATRAAPVLAAGRHSRSAQRLRHHPVARHTACGSSTSI